MKVTRAEKDRLTREFSQMATKREWEGKAVYGDFEPKTDKRVLAREAQEEAIDVLNYLRFLLRKHPGLRPFVVVCMKLANLLYIALRKLEAEELRLREVA